MITEMKQSLAQKASENNINKFSHLFQSVTTQQQARGNGNDSD